MLIEDRTKKKVSKDELGFLAVYFSVFISENSYERNKLCSIAIICGTGKITARLIAAQLRKIVDIDTKLEMFSDSQVNKELLDQFDLVLSTIKFECDTVTPIIYLKEIFDENQLKNKIESVRYTEKLNIPMLQGMESLVLSLLDEEKFFILHSDKSYMENVDYMIDKLYDLSYVDEGFKERIHTRESKSTMVFDEYIALPHAINKETDKIVFSIGVFSDDKKHEKDSKLKVIFLLAIPDIEEKDDDILVKIYDEIIAISKDKQVVENIAKVKNYRELLLYFIKQDTINFGKLRRQGKVAIGKKKGAFRAGSIVMFAVDENGIILDSSYMSGVTVLAKFKKLKGFEGLNVSTLKKEDTKGFPKQVQDAILEASSNYNVIMSGGEVPEPPSPLQKLTGSMKNLVTQK